MSNTPTSTLVVEHVRAKLTCNHVVEVPAGQPEGATVHCEKCPKGADGQLRTRRIKRLLGTCELPEPHRVAHMAPPEPARQVKSVADEHGITVQGAAVVVAASRKPSAKLVAAAEVAKADAPQAATDRAERLDLARAEHKALKAWQADGQKGDRPATPNLDAMNTDHAAGVKPGKARKANSGGRVRSPRREAAEAKRKELNGKRGRGTKVTADDLAAYVAKVRAEHPEAGRNDELEYAYWVEGMAVTRQRWYDAWAATEPASA